MITYTTTAPSHWACYFINGDSSGLDASEIFAADLFYDTLDGQIVDCSEDSFFQTHHDAYTYFPYGSDCVEYTVIASEESEA